MLTSLLPYVKKFKKELILGPFFKLLEAISELSLPFLMAYLVDYGILKQDTSVIIKTALLMLVLSTIGLGCVFICQYYAAVASQGFGTELRQAMIKKITSFSYKEIDDYHYGTLMTRTTTDVNQLQLALAMLIRLVIRAPFLTIGSIIMSWLIDPQMTVVFLITVPIFSFILFWVIKKTVPLYTAVQEKIDRLQVTISERLTGVKVIRAFAKQKESLKEAHEVSDDVATAYLRVTRLSSLLSPATFFLMNGAILCLLLLGGFNVNSGRLQAGQVLALINYMTQMLLALIVISNLVVIFTKASASGKRVAEMLQTEPSIHEPVDTLVPTNFKKTSSAVTFNHVSFKYQEQSGLVLKKIQLTILNNQHIGIIGPTGSGKTTFVQLIPRFYDATEGEVIVNDIPVNQQSLTDLRQNIGLVSQKATLFSGTIRSNLLVGKPDASDEECWQALAFADCLEFISTLDEPVSSNGANFSGGQRQRLAIARAIIKQPNLLIMDDSLSALDYQTDATIRKHIKERLTDTTTIVVSQRVSSVIDADCIYVFDQGEIVASGTHDSLLQYSRFYQDIVASQTE